MTPELLKAQGMYLLTFNGIKRILSKLEFQTKNLKALVKSAVVLVKELEGLHEHLMTLEESKISLQEIIGKICQVTKDIGADIAKLWQAVDSLKSEEV